MTPRFFSKWAGFKNLAKPNAGSKKAVNPPLRPSEYDFTKPLLDNTVEFEVGPDEDIHDVFLPSDFIYALKTTKDGKILTGGQDECLKIFELNHAGFWSCTHSIPGHRDGIVRLDLFANGKILLGGMNGAVYIIEKNAKNAWCYSLKDEPYEHAITALAIANNDKFFTASLDERIICWQRKGDGIWIHEPISIPLRVTSLLVLKNEIIAGTSSGHLLFYVLNKENKWHCKVDCGLGNDQALNALIALSPNKIVAISDYGKIFIIKYSPEKGLQYLKTFDADYSGSAGIVKLSNNLIASYGANSDGYHLWNIAAKEKWPTPIKIPGGIIRSLDSLPNGKVVALSGNNKLQIFSFANLEKELIVENKITTASLKM